MERSREVWRDVCGERCVWREMCGERCVWRYVEVFVWRDVRRLHAPVYVSIKTHPVVMAGRRTVTTLTVVSTSRERYTRAPECLRDCTRPHTRQSRQPPRPPAPAPSVASMGTQVREARRVASSGGGGAASALRPRPTHGRSSTTTTWPSVRLAGRPSFRVSSSRPRSGGKHTWWEGGEECDGG